MSRDLDAVRWRDEISSIMPEKRSRELHFANMNHGQRVAATKALSARQLRFINVIAYKPATPPGVYVEKNQLYFYLTRFLIERVSWLCRDMRPLVPEGDGKVRIVFSRRGGLAYDDFRSYMNKLKSDSGSDVQIHWPVIDIDGISAEAHSARAGLQLADIATSAVASAFEADRYGNTEWRYLEVLKPRIYSRKSKYFSYGMKFFPASESLTLSAEQDKAIAIFK